MNLTCISFCMMLSLYIICMYSTYSRSYTACIICILDAIWLVLSIIELRGEVLNSM